MGDVAKTCPLGTLCYACKATSGLRVVMSGSGRNSMCWTACENCIAARRTLTLEPRAALWMMQEHRKHLGLPAALEAEPPPLRTLRLPRVLSDHFRAVECLRSYFAGASDRPQFTGSHFDSFAGGGDRPDVAHQFTTEDIVAVSMLSVRVSAHAAIELLGRRSQDVMGTLLREVPTDLDLIDAAESEIGDRSPLAYLWRELRLLPGVGPVIASKLLARKRPRLVPIRDKIVLAELNHPGVGYWRDLQHALREDGCRLAHELTDIRDHAELSYQISVIRTFDILVWTTGKQARQADTPLLDG